MTAPDINAAYTSGTKALLHLRDSAAYHALKMGGGTALQRSHIGRCEHDLLACLEAMRPQPAPAPTRDYGFLAESGFYVTNHQSGPVTEKLVEAKRCGFRWVALVIDGNNHDGAWQGWRTAAQQAGLEVVPWAQVRTATDVGSLGYVKEYWRSPGVILNVEAESETTLKPDIVNGLTKLWTGSLAIAVDYRGWTSSDGKYHGPDWSCMADRASGHLECFDNTATHAIPVTAGLDRLRHMGFKSCVPMPAVNAGRDAYNLVGVGPRAPYVLDLCDVQDIKRWSA